MSVVDRINGEVQRYRREVVHGDRVAAAIYSFGIEMGLAIGVQAGGDAREILGQLREAVYPAGVERGQIADEMDSAAAEIVGR